MCCHSWSLFNLENLPTPNGTFSVIFRQILSLCGVRVGASSHQKRWMNTLLRFPLSCRGWWALAVLLAILFRVSKRQIQEAGKQLPVVLSILRNCGDFVKLKVEGWFMPLLLSPDWEGQKSRLCAGLTSCWMVMYPVSLFGRLRPKIARMRPFPCTLNLPRHCGTFAPHREISADLYFHHFPRCRHWIVIWFAVASKRQIRVGGQSIFTPSGLRLPPC